MAIAIDASSPAQVYHADSHPVTTASFTPPANSLLVCVFAYATDGTPSPSISSTGLTFTDRVVGQAGVRIWTAPIASSSARTVTATDGQSGFGAGAWLKVFVVTGQHATPVGNTGSGTATGDTSVNGYTSSADNSWGFAVARVSNALNTPSSTDDETAHTTDPDVYGMSLAKAAATSTASTTVTFNLGHTNGSAAWQWAAIEIVPADTSTVEQEGYRFRNDNGSETTATWRQSQDTADTAALDETVRLRMLLNSTGDRPTAQYQLEYRENSQSWYRAVGIGHPGTLPTITSATGTADATAGTTVAAAYPATVGVGDLLIWVVAKDDDATGITDTTGGLNVIANGNTESGTDGVCLFVGWEIADGNEDGTTRTFTGDSEEWQTYCIRILAGEFDASNPIDSYGTLNGGTTGEAITDAFTCVRPGGLVIACGAVDIDPMDATFSPTGWTDVADNDAGEVTAWVSTRNAATTAAETIASATFGVNTSDANVCVAFVVNAPLGTPAVTYVTSANYADGDATTAQLTAPSGKTTSDFDAGVMVEGQALADTVDITADDYTEIEWALKAQTPAVATDVYQFRVTVGGTLLTGAYTVTPELTIASAGNGTATPSAIALSASTPAPTATGGAITTPAAISRTASTPAPTTTGGATTSPAAISRTASVPAPTVTGGATTSPSAITFTVSVPAPTATGGAGGSGDATPTAISLTATVPAPTTTGGATTSPAAIARTVSTPTPTATGGAVTSPAAVAFTVTIPAPTVTGGATTSPTAVALTVTVPAPTATGGAGGDGTATPSAVSFAVTVSAPTATGGATTSPAAVTPALTISSPTVTGGAATSPAVITPAVTVPAATATGGGTASPDAVALVVVITTPTFGVIVLVYGPALDWDPPQILAWNPPAVLDWTPPPILKGRSA